MPGNLTYHDEMQDCDKSWRIAEGLKDHLQAPLLEDISIKYDLPYVEDRRTEPIQKNPTKLNPDKLRLPARLNSPLIPYSDELKNLILSNTKLDTKTWHAHHTRDVNLLMAFKEEISTTLSIDKKQIRFDIPSLKSLVKCSHSSRTELINLTALEFAKRSTSHDFSIAAMEEIKYQPNSRISSPYLSFLLCVQRMRVLLCTKAEAPPLTKIPEVLDEEDGKVYILSNGTYAHIKKNKGDIHCILVAGGHFAMYHSDKDYWFIGSFSYLDYALTLADSINNLEILSYSASYQWAREFFTILIQLAEADGDHNTIVNFMKSFEGFVLNISDYDEEFPMNWVPLMEAMHELWGYDQKFSHKRYDFTILPALLHDHMIAFPKESYLCKFISALRKMSRTQVQEVSALHKFVFYSEVDSMAGVRKFLERVHTPRPVDVSANKKITQLAKLEFTLSYCVKHKSLPMMKAPGSKMTVMRIYFSKNEMHKLKDFPLGWWDDVCPWACMDSTLTDDALEFAKDKGALKKEITGGPGDSRKELLQVIETPDYELKDLMAEGPFRRQNPEVYLTNQAASDVEHPYPARLIPKEREQKEKARLYANGELSNKHGLSVIATKMKKVLSYFDEQLMTPSDSQRKKLLHRSAQMLIDSNNFSILLDIEGHNQSMQEQNTSELLEFMGNVFGETGWGSLADYFGAHFIYHYDEYKDEVIVSKGQRGGIEGWLNPAWTLHTLLMMKLLRSMTDLAIPQLMVYSDDVNAIIELKQPTEATLQSVFSKIMKHCMKFGMVAKMSQTTLSKHRATMLRQHYSEGYRADSTLKRLMAVSGANNGQLMSEELEVAGICSSAASALEFSNNSETCCYLKNYKIGLLLSRLPQMILAHPQTEGALASTSLPARLAELLYHIKDESSLIDAKNFPDTLKAVKNDVSKYLNITGKQITTSTFRMGLSKIFDYPVAKERLVDNPERVLYLQVYDKFLQDLLYFWTYLPCSLGGLGAITHLNMVLSGHSNGYSKAVHYLHQWIANYSCDPAYFFKYLTTVLSNSVSDRPASEQSSILTSKWPSEKSITTATGSISSAIRSMVKRMAANKNILKLFEQAELMPAIAAETVKIFQENYHSRIAQFYYENSSVHFLDLLVNKIETSSGLLTNVRKLGRLRKSMVGRTILNIRIASHLKEHSYGLIDSHTDIIDYLMRRRQADYPTIKFIEAEEILYDNKLELTVERDHMITVRKSSPKYFKDGLQVYNDPKIGDEVAYKGDYLDRARLIGNKEELLAAKVVSVTKWLLTKTNNLGSSDDVMEVYDCVQACNLTLKSLTGQTFRELMPYCPDETGGEILHRIPNMRFTSNTYIRSEMNAALGFVAEISQQFVNVNNLVDSNINFDYVRMRLICAAIVKSKFHDHSSVLSRYKLTNRVGVCDVQFVSPKPLEWTSEMTIVPYSKFRGHTFSKLRFRFLATSYLTIENIDDLALLPSGGNPRDMQMFGLLLKREIVYKYARAIDKEYMTVSYSHPRESVWMPIYHKLGVLDPTFEALSPEEKFTESKRILELELEDRDFTKVVRSSDKSASILQTDCLQRVSQDKPDDQIYQTLLGTYLLTMRQKSDSVPIMARISEYNQLLGGHRHHLSNLCDSLIAELILSLHFQTKVDEGMVSFDVEKSLEQFRSAGIMTTYLQAINPELYAQTQLLGVRVLTEHFRENIGRIREYLFDVSLMTAATDVSVPELSLSVRSTSNLSSEQPVPLAAESVIYISEEIGMKAMKTLKDITGLAAYAGKCCEFGANPAVDESPTGSDTYCSQYAFFKLLMSQFGIDKDNSICDLTAGRGDGLYAGRALGLNMTSFSTLDNFTAALHHPDLDFSQVYDVTKSNTIEFINEFDFIHIDISFLKNGKAELGDLLLYLESRSLPYSIRLNSITLDVYSSAAESLDIVYSHHLAYSMSGEWRTPQIYLIGIPGLPSARDSGYSLKQTMAFRSMALSFSELLKDPFDHQLLYAPQLNSISVCLPEDHHLSSYLRYLSDRSVSEEKQYYIRRYLTEFSASPVIYYDVDKFPETAARECGKANNAKEVGGDPVYLHYKESDIGIVSAKSRPFLTNHLHALKYTNSVKTQCTLGPEDVDLMMMLRMFHPLRMVRSLCNVLLGLIRVLPTLKSFEVQEIETLKEQDMIKHYMKSSRHQEEIITALKLHMLSIHYGNPILGLIYCSLMSQNHPEKSAYMRRVRKRYKSLSGHRVFMENHMQAGNLSRSHITIMADEMFSKRPNQMSQTKKYAKDRPEPKEQTLPALDLEIDFNSLFESLEKHALNKDNEAMTWPPGEDDTMDTMRLEVERFNDTLQNEPAALQFDYDIGARVDQWAEASGLVLDPLTGRYVGFEDEEIDEYEGDW